jgi:hypothetical protein
LSETSSAEPMSLTVMEETPSETIIKSSQFNTTALQETTTLSSQMSDNFSINTNSKTNSHLQPLQWNQVQRMQQQKFQRHQCRRHQQLRQHQQQLQNQK